MVAYDCDGKPSWEHSILLGRVILRIRSRTNRSVGAQTYSTPLRHAVGMNSAFKTNMEL